MFLILPHLQAAKILCSKKNILAIPQGDMINYIHGGYLSEFEEYILIKVNNGKIIEQGKYNLENYKNKKYQAFERFYGSAKCNESLKKNGIQDVFRTEPF